MKTLTGNNEWHICRIISEDDGDIILIKPDEDDKTEIKLWIPYRCLLNVGDGTYNLMEDDYSNPYSVDIRHKYGRFRKMSFEYLNDKWEKEEKESEMAAIAEDDAQEEEKITVDTKRQRGKKLRDIEDNKCIIRGLGDSSLSLTEFYLHDKGEYYHFNDGKGFVHVVPKKWMEYSTFSRVYQFKTHPIDYSIYFYTTCRYMYSKLPGQYGDIVHRPIVKESLGSKIWTFLLGLIGLIVLIVLMLHGS